MASGSDTDPSLLTLISSLQHAGKDAIDSLSVGEEAHSQFAEMLQDVLAGNSASASAKQFGYEIRYVRERNRGYTVLSDAADGIGPTVVIADEPKRDLIIEAPHGLADRATDLQSAIALTRLGARALILAGAHRCAARSDSLCSGKTRICGNGRAPYRESDVAHNPDTRFHVAHIVFTERWPQSVVVQLHGFSVKGTDAWVVLSDGSHERRPGDRGLSGQVRDGVRAWFGKPERAVSCQDTNDKRYSYRTLCARTNVQGRHLNGAVNVCHGDGETASGRFLHAEQAWEIRREVRQHWRNIDRAPLATVVIDAVGRAIPCTLADCD